MSRICMGRVWNMKVRLAMGAVLCAGQDSHPPRTYRVHSAYSRPQKGDEVPARAIWGPAPGPAAQCVMEKTILWNMHGIRGETASNM